MISSQFHNLAFSRVANTMVFCPFPIICNKSFTLLCGYSVKAEADLGLLQHPRWSTFQFNSFEMIKWSTCQESSVTKYSTKLILTNGSTKFWQYLSNTLYQNQLSYLLNTIRLNPATLLKLTLLHVCFSRF